MLRLGGPSSGGPVLSRKSRWGAQYLLRKWMAVSTAPSTEDCLCGWFIIPEQRILTWCWERALFPLSPLLPCEGSGSGGWRLRLHEHHAHLSVEEEFHQNTFVVYFCKRGCLHAINRTSVCTWSHVSYVQSALVFLSCFHLPQFQLYNLDHIGFYSIWSNSI